MRFNWGVRLWTRWVACGVNYDWTMASYWSLKCDVCKVFRKRINTSIGCWKWYRCYTTVTDTEDDVRVVTKTTWRRLKCDDAGFCSVEANVLECLLAARLQWFCDAIQKFTCLQEMWHQTKTQVFLLSFWHRFSLQYKKVSKEMLLAKSVYTCNDLLHDTLCYKFTYLCFQIQLCFVQNKRSLNKLL